MPNRSRTGTRGLVAALCVAATFAGRHGAADIVEDFSEGGWRASNPKAPAEVTQEPGKLVLRDLPGGEVTWGSSASKRFPDVDLAQTPFLVLRVGELEGGFQVKLAGGADRPKYSVIQGRQPGLYVLDIPAVTGWTSKGPKPLNVMIYTTGDATQAEYNLIKITGTLSAEEEARLGKLPGAAMEPPPDVGLDALAVRVTYPPEDLPAGETERAVYTDAVTGHTVWRFTGHPAIDRHVYYDIPAWNADGSLLYWISRRPGSTGWLANADGSDPRPLPQPQDGGSVRGSHWSPSDPRTMLFVRPGETSTGICSLDVYAGTVDTIIEVPVPGDFNGRTFSEFCPPHPDGHWYLLRWGGQDRNNTFLVAVDAQTNTFHRLETGFPTHRVRFTKAPDHSIFVNSNTDPEKPGVRSRTEWLITLDGTVKRLPSAGGHPDWSPDGQWLSAYADGGIWLINRDGRPRQLLVDLQAGGHGGFSITSGRYHVSDAPGHGPFANMLFVTELESGRVTPIAWHGASYSGWGSGVPDPEATHPAPICSPDETKIVYDSDMTGQPEAYVAVWKRPQAPQNVRLKDDRLLWDPAEYHREIAAYAVYAWNEQAWTLRTTVQAPTTELELAPGRYAVAAREHSGLESLLAVADQGGLTSDRLAPPAPSSVRVTDVGMTHASLRWQPVNAPDVAHYNVYAAFDAGTRPGRATVIRSPQVPHVTDWGVQPGQTLYYRITAVDWQGNESRPGPVTAVTLDGVACPPTTIELEAESGEVVAPMVVASDDNALGGSFVHVPDEFSDEAYVEVGHLTLRFTVPGDGVFRVWARAMGLDGKSDSFYVSLDNGPEANWPVRRARQGKPIWQWQRIGGLDGVLLRAGEHVLRFRSREDGTRLDNVLITNDMDASFR